MSFTDYVNFVTGHLVTDSEFNAIGQNTNYLEDALEAQMTNKDASTLSTGAVVIPDTSNDDAFKTTTTANFVGRVGILMQDNIATTFIGRVRFTGVLSINVQGNVTRGNYLVTSTTAGRAKDGGAVRIAPAFAQALTGYAGGGAGVVLAVMLGGSGLWLQYATVTIHTNGSGNGSASITWPVAFNTTVGAVAGNAGATISAVTTSGATVAIGGQNADTDYAIAAFALGY